MPRRGELQIVFDRNDDLGDGGTGHAVFLGDLGLRLWFAVDDGQITFRLHRGLARLRIGQRLQQANRRLIPEGAAGMTAALLRFVVLPEGAKDFQRPPIQQRDLRGKRGRRRDAKPCVEENILGGIVWKFGAATCFRIVGGIGKLSVWMGHYGPGASRAWREIYKARTICQAPRLASCASPPRT